MGEKPETPLRKKPKFFETFRLGGDRVLIFRWRRKRVDTDKSHGWAYTEADVSFKLCGIGHEEDWFDGPINIYKCLFFEVVTYWEFDHD